MKKLKKKACLAIVNAICAISANCSNIGSLVEGALESLKEEHRIPLQSIGFLSPFLDETDIKNLTKALVPVIPKKFIKEFTEVIRLGINNYINEDPVRRGAFSSLTSEEGAADLFFIFMNTYIFRTPEDWNSTAGKRILEKALNPYQRLFCEDSYSFMMFYKIRGRGFRDPFVENIQDILRSLPFGVSAKELDDAIFVLSFRGNIGDDARSDPRSIVLGKDPREYLDHKPCYSERGFPSAGFFAGVCRDGIVPLYVHHFETPATERVTTHLQNGGKVVVVSVLSKETEKVPYYAEITLRPLTLEEEVIVPEGNLPIRLISQRIVGSLSPESIEEPYESLKARFPSISQSANFRLLHKTVELTPDNYKEELKEAFVNNSEITILIEKPLIEKLASRLEVRYDLDSLVRRAGKKTLWEHLADLPEVEVPTNSLGVTFGEKTIASLSREDLNQSCREKTCAILGLPELPEFMIVTLCCGGVELTPDNYQEVLGEAFNSGSNLPITIKIGGEQPELKKALLPKLEKDKFFPDREVHALLLRLLKSLPDR